MLRIKNTADFNNNLALRVNTLFLLAPSLCVAQLLLACVAVLGLSNSSDKTSLFFVWLILLSTILADAFLFIIYKNSHQQHSSQTWFYVFCTLKFLAAAIWGACFFYLLSITEPSQQWFIVLFALLTAAITASNLLWSRLALGFSVVLMLAPMQFMLAINMQPLPAWSASIMLILGMAYIIGKHWFELGRTQRATQEHLDKLELKRALEQSKKHIQLLKQKMSISDAQDSTTKLPNFAYFEQALAHQLVLGKQNNGDFSLLMVDIDNFKQLNKKLGYDKCNQCLHQVAQSLKGGLRRAGDLVARYESDSFLVLLPATPLNGALIVGESLRKSLHVLSLQWSDLKPLTLSIGAVSYQSIIADNPSPSSTEIIEFAQRALAVAKSDAGNCVRHLKTCKVA